MTKQELIAAIAENTGDSKRAVEDFINQLGVQATQALRRGDDVILPGIGKLVPVQRAARQGRNPITGEAVRVPAVKVAKLKPSKALKDALNAA